MRKYKYASIGGVSIAFVPLYTTIDAIFRQRGGFSRICGVLLFTLAA
jgi:hypothetical protein